MFPSALSFIAVTVGGVSSKQNASPLECGEGNSADGRGPSGVGKDEEGEADCNVDVSVAVTSPIEDLIGKGTHEHREDCMRREQPADLTCLNNEVILRTTMEASGLSAIEAGRSITREDECSDVEHCSHGNASRQHRHRHQERDVPSPNQPCQHQSFVTPGVRDGKCLVVCPNGAEASVVVCLAALLAFFSAPSVPAERTAAANERVLYRRQDEIVDADIRNLSALATSVAIDTATSDRESTWESDGMESEGNNGVQTAPGALSVAAKNRTKAPLEVMQIDTTGLSGMLACEPEEEITRGKEDECFTCIRTRNRVTCFEVLPKGVEVTKTDVRWRFLLMQQECPWARPPRRLMQELNEYFMTRGEHSWNTLREMLSSPETERWY